MKTPLPGPIRPLDEVLEALASEPRLVGAMHPTVRGRWAHWDRLRHLDTPVAGLDHELWWHLVKLARLPLLSDTRIPTMTDSQFQLAVPTVMLEMLQSVDTQLAGRIGVGEVIGEHQARNSWLVTSMAEEAIRSSQLEGASTSRVVAKEMLLTDRPPRTRSERMIANNYKAMQFVRAHRDEPLSVEMIRQLHITVTEETLDDPVDAGRIQGPDEDRVAVWSDDGFVLHQPPPAEWLPERLSALCSFANGDSAGDDYLHPVVRSILIHFWLSHDHPFVDGNGRTARALFYWSMLRRDYWLAEYLSISAILRSSSSKYVRSFLYTEMDDGDLTYFVLHHLDVILRALTGLEDYLERKMKEVGRARRLLRSGTFNHRQAALLEHAIRHPNSTYTYKSHAGRHAVVLTTARTDLLELAELGLLTQQRVGRTFHFSPNQDLHEQLDDGRRD